jgi:hypothetical protein
MAKALYGFHGGPDPRIQAELTMLRARVRQLEAELAELRAGTAGLVEGELELELLTTTQDAALV